MLYLAMTAALLAASFIANRRKTLRALVIAWKRFARILPLFLLMLVLVSTVLYLVPGDSVYRLLGVDNPWLGLVLALTIGSVSLMPGFIAFPLCGILHGQGVPLMIISAFTTTMMMVGLVTLPLEKAYFGMRTALVRNAVSLLMAVIVALATGLVFGELGLL
jgi:uncharacterized membrane protein YraQ (UPF0718 family)